MYLAADAPLTPLDLSGITRAGRDTVLPGLEDRRTILFGTGRAALWALLSGLGVGAGDEVLLPAYLCESVVSPVQVVGGMPIFYPVGRDLSVDPAAVEALVGARTRVVVVIHYLGFPGPVGPFQELCARRGIALVEDCAHALFSRLGDRPLGSFGDAAVFSPWKSLPLPDGGALVTNRPDLAIPAPAAHPGTARTVARLGYRALGGVESAIGWSPRLTLLQRSRLRRGMHDRTSGAPVVVEAASLAARRMLAAVSPKSARHIVGRRRANYRRLHAAASRVTWARPLFETLSEGTCPLGLPLVAEDRDRWRDLLLARGVNVRTYWEHLPAVVDLDQHRDAAWLRDRILILPVHQGLTDRQIAWLARLLTTLDRRN
jgi:perosamine synthetase